MVRLEELEMETIKQKMEGQSTKDTEVALVVQIVTEEEYNELFGTERDDEIRDRLRFKFVIDWDLNFFKFFY